MVDEKFLFDNLSKSLVRNRNKHIYITDTLLDYAKKNYSLRDIILPARLCYSIEHSYWCVDDLADMDFEKKERYWVIFSQLWFRRLFNFKLIDSTLSIEEKKEVLNAINVVEDELWLLAEREEESRKLSERDLEKAIINVLFGKSFHGKIYVQIFNVLLKTDKFNSYIKYRMVELLYKDLSDKDILEDLTYNNLSVGTLIIGSIKRGEIKSKEVSRLINKIAESLFNEIDEDYFKEKIIKVINQSKSYLEKLDFSKYVN